MRVSILLPDLGGGGAEKVSLDLARQFSSAGCNVDFVLLRKQGELLEEVESEFAVTCLGVKKIRSAIGPFRKYIIGHQPDVILAAMWPLTTLAVITNFLCKRKAQIISIEHSVLSSQYSGRGLFHRLLLILSAAFTYRASDYSVGVSQGVADDMEMISFLGGNKVRVINNPVPPHCPADIEQKLTVESLWGDFDGCKILSVGSFKEAKRFDILLKAFSIVSNHLNVKLILLGDGPLRKDLVVLSETLGISERVIMPGFIPKTSPFYECSDLFVLSSDREGLPTVIIESLAAGTPVVATDCKSGPAEILDDGKYGKLVPVGDPAALAKAIEESLSEPFDPKALKARAKDFSPEIIAKQYLELVQ